MDVSGSCLELALQGEHHCQKGDHRGGVQFFEAAIEKGTEDLRTLSAIYSQLGNAYFHLRAYDKALEWHRKDLHLAQEMGDRLGEGKASGNVGNTLKVLGKFDEAILNCTKHLDTSLELKNRMGEARALYNLGNIYHMQGKHLGRSRHRGPGDLPVEVEQTLLRAVEFYEENVRLVCELSDRASEGRAYGNLGNVHHLLGNFTKAVEYHAQRLAIAREDNDLAAQCRAFSNLANANVFLGEFETGIEYYVKTREVAQQLKDKAMDAQACFNIANTHTFLQRHDEAVGLYLEHLGLVKELRDRVGEGRAYWSLGHVYTVLGDYEKALEYTESHLLISRGLGDRTGELAAQMNLVDLKSALGIHDGDEKLTSGTTATTSSTKQVTIHENGGRPSGSTTDVRRDNSGVKVTDKELNEDFFDLLYKSQSSRMDDQRYEFPSKLPSHGRNTALPPAMVRPGVDIGGETRDGLMDMIARMQGDRMEEQRCEFSPAVIRKGTSAK